MNIKVLGISGSPIKNSNTDRLVKTILDATEIESREKPVTKNANDKELEKPKRKRGRSKKVRNTLEEILENLSEAHKSGEVAACIRQILTPPPSLFQRIQAKIFEEFM